MKKEILIIFSSALLIQSATAQQLMTDSLFGINGYANYPIPSAPECTEITDLQNGYFLIGGYNYDINNNDYHIDIIKSDYCGDPDSTFGVNGLVYHTFSQRNLMFDMEVQSDGKTLTCGIESTSNAGSGQIPYVSRFNADGTPDTTFGTMGSNSLRFDNVSSGRFFGVRQMPDGRVICTGYSTGNINGGTSGIGAMRFTPQGLLDPAFSGDGIERYDVSIGNGLGDGFLSEDNEIIAVGSWVDGTFLSHFIVAVWDSSGLFSTNFNTGGLYMDSTTSIANDVYAVRDSLGLITMAAMASPGPNAFVMHRLLATGFPDLSFGVNGFVTITNAAIYTVRGFQLFPGGKYLISGSSTTGEGYCMMINNDGTPDMSFGNAGFMLIPVAPAGTGNSATGIIVLPNGQWVAGGNASALNASRFAQVSNVPHITQQFNYLETTGNGTYQWYLNGVAIAGSINDTLHFNQNGSYTVELTGDYGCKYMSDPYIVTNASVEEPVNSGITFYPSPANSSVFFNNTSGNTITVSLYAVTGNRIHSFIIENGIQEKDIAFLAAGLYFIRLDKSERFVKFIKE